MEQSSTFIKLLVSKLQLIRCEKGCSSTQMSSKIQENKIIDVLRELNIKQLDKKFVKQTVLDDGIYYIHQPHGSQQSPDFFLIRRCDSQSYVLGLEAKKGSRNITWNDGYPNTDFVYLFTDTKRNTSKVFLSDHLSNIKEREDWCNLCKEIKALNIKYKGLGRLRLYTRKVVSQTITDAIIQQETNSSVRKHIRKHLGYTKQDNIVE